MVVICNECGAVSHYSYDFNVFKCTHCGSTNLSKEHDDYFDEVYEKVDMVAHPPHYQSKTGIEVIDVIKAFTSELKGIEATDTGNIIKYICRWKHKNGLEDLEKAQWYINHLIDEVKENNKGEK